MIYFLTFGFSIILAEFAYISKEKYLKWFFLLLSITIPAVLAGLRATEIGTDTPVYYAQYYIPAENLNSLKKLLEYTKENDFETGYMILNYLVGKIFGSFHAMMFIVNFLTLFFIYNAIECLRERRFKILAILIFYMMFYNDSFNIVRQVFACSIVTFSVCKLFYTNKKRYMLFEILAVSMHKSALIGLILYLLYFLIRSKFAKNIKKIYYMIMIIIFSMMQIIIEFLGNLSFFAARNTRFLVRSFISSITIRGYLIFFKVLPVFLILVISGIYYKKMADNEKKVIYILQQCGYTSGNFKKYAFKSSFYEYAVLIAFTCVLSNFIYFGGAVSRLFLYTEMIGMVMVVPMFLSNIKDRDLQRLCLLFISVNSIANWIIYYLIMKNTETYPYMFYWQ